MHHLVTIAVATMALAAPDAGEFVLQNSDPAKAAHGREAVEDRADQDRGRHEVLRDREGQGAGQGRRHLLTSPTGDRYYTEETDAEGYAEVLVPVGQKYEVTYLSLGRKDIAANVTVTSEPKQTIKLTLRYKRMPPPPPFVLSGVNFDTGKAIIRPESKAKLDVVAEFMQHKKSAQVEISGHTDNVGQAEDQQGPVGEAREGLPRIPGLQGHRRQPHHGHRPRRRATGRAQRHRREPAEEPAHRGRRAATG